MIFSLRCCFATHTPCLFRCRFIPRDTPAQQHTADFRRCCIAERQPAPYAADAATIVVAVSYMLSFIFFAAAFAIFMPMIAADMPHTRHDISPAFTPLLMRARDALLCADAHISPITPCSMPLIITYYCHFFRLHVFAFADDMPCRCRH